MPVQSDETHLLEAPRDDNDGFVTINEARAAAQSECGCKGGQGRTAADLEANMQYLFALSLLAMLGLVLCLAVALLR